MTREPFPGFWYGAERGHSAVHVVARVELDSLTDNPQDGAAVSFCGRSLSVTWRLWAGGRICAACRDALAYRGVQ